MAVTVRGRVFSSSITLPSFSLEANTRLMVVKKQKKKPSTPKDVVFGLRGLSGSPTAGSKKKKTYES